MRPLIQAIFATTTLVAGMASAAELTIELSDVKTTEGKVMIAVFSSSDSFLKKPVLAASTAADPAGKSVVLKDLPEGEYALVVYHDANGNGKMDKNMMGIPTEDYAFSNNAMGKFGPPSFDSAKITLAAAGSTTKISLK
jgi:uncharacterized protein (DUF2141 family)